MVERLAVVYNLGAVKPTRTVGMGAAKWNQMIHVTDLKDIWATDTVSRESI
jgi:hypothetical protein